MSNFKGHSRIISLHIRYAVMTALCWAYENVHADRLGFTPGMPSMPSGRTEGQKEYRVYTDSTKAPKVTTKKPLYLSAAQGSRPQLGVSCEYAQVRRESLKSTDSYFGSERQNSVSKFPRLTLSGIKRAYEELSVDISYTFRENNTDRTVSETVKLDSVLAGRNIVIDFAGIRDTTGGAVDSTSLGAFTTLHVKKRYYAADLVEASVKVTDKQGTSLYDGASRAAPKISSNH